MRRVFFLLPLKTTFADLLVNWIKEYYKGQDLQVHTLTLLGGKNLQVFFDTQEQHIPELIREYRNKFPPAHREHLQGESDPEVTEIEVKILVPQGKKKV